MNIVYVSFYKLTSPSPSPKSKPKGKEEFGLRAVSIIYTYSFASASVRNSVTFPQPPLLMFTDKKMTLAHSRPNSTSPTEPPPVSCQRTDILHLLILDQDLLPYPLPCKQRDILHLLIVHKTNFHTSCCSYPCLQTNRLHLLIYTRRGAPGRVSRV